MNKRDAQIQKYFPDWEGTEFVAEDSPQSDNPNGDGVPMTPGFGLGDMSLVTIVGGVMLLIAAVCLFILFAGGAM